MQVKVNISKFHTIRVKLINSDDALDQGVTPLEGRPVQ